MKRHIRTFQEAPIEVPENLEPVYANHVLVRYSPTRFLLDFAQVLPGVRTHRVRARISLTSHDALLLSEMLAEHRLPLVDDVLGDDAWLGHRLPCPVENGEQDDTRPLGQAGEAGRSGGRPAKPQVLVPPGLPAIVSNFVIISSCSGDVILDFAYLVPNLFKIHVAARLIVTPACLDRFIETLEQGLSDFATRHGPVSEPESRDCARNLRSPAVWGTSVPFATN
jgi:hypothetical protein